MKTDKLFDCDYCGHQGISAHENQTQALCKCGSAMDIILERGDIIRFADQNCEVHEICGEGTWINMPDPSNHDYKNPVALNWDTVSTLNINLIDKKGIRYVKIFN